MCGACVFIQVYTNNGLHVGSECRMCMCVCVCGAVCVRMKP